VLSCLTDTGDSLTEQTAEAKTISTQHNPGLCHECGGLCCCLYLANDEDGAYIGEGWLPEYIAVWETRLTESGALLATPARYEAGVAGVAPLHDPRVSHRPDAVGAAYRASLPTWIDVRKCAFCHPESGCLLPRSHRAPICNEWVCELWEEER
jgi:hypothetical protein